MRSSTCEAQRRECGCPRLSRFFGTSERFWFNLQTRYDLDVERDRLSERLAEEVSPVARAS
jgi:plasmid maintenance system antidote protein VapI